MPQSGLGGRPLGGYPRGLNGAGRTQGSPAVAGDPTLTLNYNYLLNSGSTIGASVVTGPTPTYSGNGGTSMIWDENGTLVSTTDAEPRYDHDPITGAALGLLMEPARTNEAIQSEDFGTSWDAWGEEGLVNTNVTAAPDGETTGDRIIDNNAGGTGQVARQLALTIANGGAQSLSFYCKSDGLTKSAIRTFGYDAGGVGTSHFNLATEATGTSTHDESSVEGVGDGWFRCSIQFTTVTDLAGSIVVYAVQTDASFNVDLDLTSSIFIWGAQLETGGNPTSYIPTTTVAVTRTKDVCNTTSLAWLDASNGMMFAQASIPKVSAVERSLMTIDDGGTTDVMRLYLDAAENGNFETVNSGDTNGASDGAAVIAVDTVFKMAGT